MRTTKFIVFLATIALAAFPLVMAQDDGFNGKLGAETIQTKNLPAGTVNEPGSQLLFVLDSGINALEAIPEDNLAQSMAQNGFSAASFQNFISITNTNPTDSVTVHFRYVNATCGDILDFLVVLSCNDTMLIDPFDYDIPGAGFNVSARLFGGTNVPSILASDFGDGRFLLTVTAVGAVQDSDDFADILFPAEGSLIGTIDPACTGTANPGNTNVRGSNNGINTNNLHVLNSSAISFDYLTGFQTVAVPTDFIVGGTDVSNDLAYGNSAWVRPSVDRGSTNDAELLLSGGTGDGDGPHALPFTVLTGSETLWINNARTVNGPNNFQYLRSEVHGGAFENTGDASLVDGGALGWTLFPLDLGAGGGIIPSQQLLNMVSFADDYNGFNNASTAAFNDNSYGIDTAQTVYDLLIYNNDEVLLDVETPDVVISPPPDVAPISLVIFVRCLSVFNQDPDQVSDAINFGDFSIEDLFSLNSQVSSFLATPVAVNDERGPGWIRINRSQTTLVEPFAPNVVNNVQVGDPNGGSTPSFVTIAQSVNRFEGFGASWWLPTAARITGSAE